MPTNDWVQQRAKAFNDRRDSYEFLRAAYEGGARFLSQHLAKFSPRETDADYKRRLASAVYPNLVRSVLRLYRDHVFKLGDAIARDVTHDGYKLWLDDVDRTGRSANDFWGRIGQREMLYGWMGVLVDMPAAPDIGRETTRADMAELDMTPYLVPFTPSEIVDWSVDAWGHLNWVHLLGSEVEDPDPAAKREDTTLHRLYTRERWAVYNDEGVEIDGADHTVGEVPFVVVQFEPSEEHAFIGTSFMDDYARLNRELANSISMRADFLNKNALQLLTIQIPSVDDEDDKPDLALRNLLEYAGDTTPSFIGPNVAGAEYMFRHDDALRTAMYQMAMLHDKNIEGASAQAQSGIAKVIDFEQTNTALTAFADGLQEAETRVSRLWFKWQGIEWKDDWTIDYPDSFNVRSLADELELAHGVREAYGDASPTMTAAYLRQLVNRLIDDLDADVQAQIEDELRENTLSLATSAQLPGRVAREALDEDDDEDLIV